MAAEFDRAVAHFIANCVYVTAVHDLVTIWPLQFLQSHSCIPLAVRIQPPGEGHVSITLIV